MNLKKIKNCPPSRLITIHPCKLDSEALPLLLASAKRRMVIFIEIRLWEPAHTPGFYKYYRMAE